MLIVVLEVEFFVPARTLIAVKLLISYGHHTFSLTYKPSNKKIVLPSQPQCPHLSMSRNNFSSPPLVGDLPFLSPIVNTIVGSVLAHADLPNSASVRNAHVASEGGNISSQRHASILTFAMNFSGTVATRTKQR